MPVAYNNFRNENFLVLKKMFKTGLKFKLKVILKEEQLLLTKKAFE